jgi:hypothetical protein
MQGFQEELDKQLVDIKDVAKYYRHRLDPNDRKLAYELKEHFNNLYKTFEEQILPRFANKEGKITTKMVSILWVIYEDSHEVLNFIKNSSKVIRLTDPELAKWWINEFNTKSVVELFGYGKNAVSAGYSIVLDYYRDWMVNEKYNRIYSQSNDFDEWVKLADKNITLMNDEEFPYDLRDLHAKAKTILATRRSV